MRIKERQTADIDIISLSGKVIGGEDVFNLCSDLKNRLSTDRRNVVIDLGDVEWTNSCGLGMLIGLHVTAVNAGRRMALANIESIRKLLTMTRLDEILNTYDSLDDAIDSF